MPDNLVAIEVSELLTDVDRAAFAGLFVPFHPESWITVRWSTGKYLNSDELADQIVDELLQDEARIEPTGHATTLLFARTLKGYFVAEHIIQTIRKRLVRRLCFQCGERFEMVIFHSGDKCIGHECVFFSIAKERR